MRRVMIVAALVVSGAVFAADLAKDRLDHTRATYPNSEVATPAVVGDEHGGGTPLAAPGMRFRLADDVDADMTYGARWRVPEAFGYHPPAFDSEHASGDSRFRDEPAPEEGRGTPRVQF